MLPIHSDGVGRAKRIALMPLALTADVTLLCGRGILQGWGSIGSSNIPYA
ncbi:MAG TPA: hypothetical protein GYA07_01670 [Verrucomicrobia bacterium]|nr:hypothetical protein [Verrucomicrobiota bacterium]